MRILAIDYGRKRMGIAVTDPAQIIAQGLETVAAAEVLAFLKDYFSKEEVERIVVGEPFHDDGSPAQLAAEIDLFCAKLAKTFPEIPVSREDERYTSSLAKDFVMNSGLKKKARQEKGRVDKIAAALILESWMNRHKW